MKDDFVVKNEFGYCVCGFEETYVHIYNLFVLPEFRRLGKAREILQIAIDKIRDLGYSGKIGIVAIPKDPDGISLDKLKNFYQSMGLEVFEYYG